MSLKELEKRVQILEDIESIKRLKFRYARACDNKYDADEMIEIFTEDAIWDGGKEFGIYKGKREMYDFFKKVSSDILFALHYFTTPNIVVDGDNAKAIWYLWDTSTLSGNKAIFLAGYEHDKYRKINGRWWQSEMKLDLCYMTPFEEGWHKTRIIEYE